MPYAADGMLNGFEVFDVHHHVGDASAVLGATVALTDSGATQPEDIAAEELSHRLAIMDAGGVDWAAVIPGHGYYRPNGLADTRRINDGIAAYRDAHPDRFPVAIGVIEPMYGSHSQAEIAPNLLFDTSLASGFDLIESFARTFGADRVVFGTDLYSWPLGRRISPRLPEIVACGLDDEAKRAILAGNARRLFSVEP